MTFYIWGIANELNQKVDLDVWKIKSIRVPGTIYEFLISLEGETKEVLGNSHQTTSKC